VLPLKVLVVELFSVYTLTPGTVAHGEITALNHETLDHPVEA
jgi:hypothetical protein